MNLHVCECMCLCMLSVRRLSTKKGMATMPHPPYSPDLAANDFILFPRMKRDMKEKRFADVDEIKNKTS